VTDSQEHKVVLYFEKARKSRKKGELEYQKRAKEEARLVCQHCYKPRFAFFSL
jgi:hypothetical protein